jgi:RNA polymerase sigma factor (sigma-70 family)
MATRQMNSVLQHIRRLAEERDAGRWTDRQLLDRFLNHKDEKAFAGLVQRHGPMVLALAWRILRDQEDAEDVFQAAFLVLSKQARSIRRRDSIGGWLYRVAYRLALKAKSQSAQQIHRFALPDQTSNVSSSNVRLRARSDKSKESDPLSQITWREVCTALDEELARLPDHLRAPLVLCYLQGHTQDEALQQLGWSKSTFRRRLEDGRSKLCLRLTSRGITLSAGLWATLLSDPLQALTQSGSPAAALSSALTNSTVQAAIPFATGELAGAAVSPHVTLLVHEALKSAAIHKLKWIALLGMATALTTGLGLAAHHALTASTSTDQPKQQLALVDEQRTQPAPEKPNQPRLDLYGDPLPPRAVRRLGTVRFRHGQQIYSVAYSPDGKLIASGSLGSIRLWEAVSGKPVAVLSGYKKHVFSLKFSKDSSQLVSAGIDEMDPGIGKLVLWDLAAKRPIFTVSHNGWVRIAAISSDGKHVAMGCDDGTLLLLDGKSGKELHSLGQPGRFMQAVAFSPDAHSLAAQGDNNSIQLWDTTTGEKVRHLSDAGRLRSLAFSPDGKLLASAHDTGNFPNENSVICLWDLVTGKKLQTLAPHEGTVFSVAFSPDQKQLASAGLHGLVVLSDVTTGKEIRKLRTLDSWIQGIAFAPDGGTLIAGSSLGRIQVWDAKTGEERLVVDEHGAGLADIDLSPDGTVLASASADKTALWDLATGRKMKVLRGTERGPYCARFSPDGKRIVTSGGDGLVRFWNLVTGAEERQIKSPDDSWDARVVYSASGKILATAHVGTIRLWDAVTNKEICQLKGHDGYVVDMAFSPDDRLLASAAHAYGGAKDNRPHEDWSIRLWDVTRGVEIERIPQLYAGHLAFRPDGRILMWHGSGPMHERDLVTGEERPGKEGETAFAFSRDGRWLASAMNDGAIRISEIATGQEVMRLDASPAIVQKLIWTPVNRTLISSQDDATVVIWDLSPVGSQTGQKAIEAQQLVEAWDSLKNKDSITAYRTIWLLASSGQHAIDLLKNNIKPVPVTGDTQRILQLVRDLDHEDFTKRETASRDLTSMGANAEAALVEALKTNQSLEFRNRARAVLRNIARTKKSPAPEELRNGRALAVLERLATPSALELLKNIASGAPEARLTQEAKASLARLQKPTNR